MAKSGFAKEHLRSFVDRIERLEEERSALTADIREVYSEAKGTLGSTLGSCAKWCGCGNWTRRISRNKRRFWICI